MKIVLTGGKFNMLHPGHIYLLKFARRHGDRLVVVLAHDSRNKRNYAQNAKRRKEMLEQLRLVDKVVIGQRDDFMKVVRKEKPNVIVLGYDQRIPGGNKKLLEKMGIRIVRCRRFGKYKSRKMDKSLMIKSL
jgi:cytidyltransferase-like protein